MAATMLGAWGNYYTRREQPHAYGDEATYRIAEDWLQGLHVEDWGCGKGFFSTIHDGPCVGVDGTHNLTNTDIVADLVHYRSRTPGLLLRHVLEHNDEWQTILRNAVDSFTVRMVLVCFTPMLDGDRAVELARTPMATCTVPDLSLPHPVILAALPGTVEWFDVPSIATYGSERVYLVQR